MKKILTKLATVCLATTLICGTFGTTVNAAQVGERNGVLIGDINGDGVIDLSDATKLQQLLNDPLYMLIIKLGGYAEACDANGDGKINQTDVRYILNYIMGY